MKSDLMLTVCNLWDDLSAFPAGATEEALLHAMRWFQEHLDADNVIWIGSIRMLDAESAAKDPLLGWRLRARQSLILESENYQKLRTRYLANEHYGRLTSGYYRKDHHSDADVHIGMTGRQLVQKAGTFRYYQMRDGWINFAEFRRTEHYRLYYLDQGITDRVWIIFPIGSTTESIFLLDRYRSGKNKGRHFTKKQVETAALASRGARAFHRRLLLGHGVYKGVKALTPLKMRILRELLGDRSEKEIAMALDQNPVTMREYVTELYAEFGVRTRLGLTALWLNES